MKNVIMLAVSGSLGTISRYGMGKLANKIFPGSFITGTFLVNIVGSFAFGFIWALANSKNILDKDISMFILVGFMGAFTTFSTFIFETGKFIKESSYMLAFLNIAAHILLGLGFMFLGLTLAKFFVKS
jgi:fluoride exporter